MLTDEEFLRNLMGLVPGLSDDMTAIGVLRDPSLLGSFFDPKHVKRTAERHPLLFRALDEVLTQVFNQRMNDRGNSESALLLDGHPFYADTDSEGEEERGDRQVAAAVDAARGGGARMPITPALLQQALNAAGAGAAGRGQGQQAAGPARTQGQQAAAQPAAMPVPIQQPTRAPPNSMLAGGGAPGGGLITPEMLQQAMQSFLAPGNSATGGAAPSSSGQPATSANYDNLLPQLHEVGFMDDAENRAALAATGGDFEAALVWIVDRREQNEQLD